MCKWIEMFVIGSLLEGNCDMGNFNIEKIAELTETENLVKFQKSVKNGGYKCQLFMGMKFLW